MKKILYFFIGFIFFLTIAKPTNAQTSFEYNQNNKFGIHILSENDINDASALVNSNGGSWGYVTIVIREDERDLKRWVQAFNQLGEHKLIPIVRMATSQQETGWRKPSADDALNWVKFLEKLPWPTEKKHIMVYNEPNHSGEWGGEIKPDEYARVYRAFWEEFKKSDKNFVVLPAALDLAAPNGEKTMNAVDFWQKMYQEDDLIFTLFDGWNSHSYPNPGFCGSPKDTGRTSIQGYVWEKENLKKLYLNPDLPVYITETGWGCSLLSESSVSANYEYAFNHIWSDPQVVAVTPFVLNYPNHPFAHFSFKNPSGQFFGFYEVIKNLPKIKGEPVLTQKIKEENS